MIPGPIAVFLISVVATLPLFGLLAITETFGSIPYLFAWVFGTVTLVVTGFGLQLQRPKTRADAGWAQLRAELGLHPSTPTESPMLSGRIHDRLVGELDGRELVLDRSYVGLSRVSVRFDSLPRKLAFTAAHVSHELGNPPLALCGTGDARASRLLHVRGERDLVQDLFSNPTRVEALLSKMLTQPFAVSEGQVTMLLSGASPDVQTVRASVGQAQAIARIVEGQAVVAPKLSTEEIEQAYAQRFTAAVNKLRRAPFLVLAGLAGVIGGSLVLLTAHRAGVSESVLTAVCIPIAMVSVLLIAKGAFDLDLWDRRPHQRNRLQCPRCSAHAEAGDVFCRKCRIRLGTKSARGDTLSRP